MISPSWSSPLATIQFARRCARTALVGHIGATLGMLGTTPQLHRGAG
jgi:hypothetical protein